MPDGVSRDTHSGGDRGVLLAGSDAARDLGLACDRQAALATFTRNERLVEGRRGGRLYYGLLGLWRGPWRRGFGHGLDGRGLRLLGDERDVLDRLTGAGFERVEAALDLGEAIGERVGGFGEESVEAIGKGRVDTDAGDDAGDQFGHVTPQVAPDVAPVTHNTLTSTGGEEVHRHLDAGEAVIGCMLGPAAALGETPGALDLNSERGGESRIRHRPCRSHVSPLSPPPLSPLCRGAADGRRHPGVASIPDRRRGTKVRYCAHVTGSHRADDEHEDKRRAVMKLLNDPEWSQWSDREIARRCAVNNATISRMRPQVDTVEKQQYERTFNHPKTGKPTTMNVSNIGGSPRLGRSDLHLLAEEARLSAQGGHQAAQGDGLGGVEPCSKAPVPGAARSAATGPVHSADPPAPDGGRAARLARALAAGGASGRGVGSAHGVDLILHRAPLPLGPGRDRR